MDTPLNRRLVRLNIGGTLFTTLLDTLTSQETFFSGLMSGKFNAVKDEHEAYFIDRDPRNFGIILNYLRGQEIFVDDLSENQLKELVSDCEFYQVSGLLKLLVDKHLVEIKEERRSNTIKHFVFGSDRDSNGILYWLGIDKGKAPNWINPAHRGFVQISVSSLMYGDPSVIVSRDVEEGSSKYSLECWLSIKFKDIVVKPKHYVLQGPKSNEPGIAKTWEFQASNDGKSWSVISRVDKTDENVAVRSSSSCSIECNSFFDHFRIFHATHDWTLHRLMFANLEIYGEVKEISP